MGYIIGILILALFFGLAVHATRGGNPMMGMLITVILWTILPMTDNLLASNPEFIAANEDSIRTTWIQAFSKVFQNGPEGWGLVLANAVFGTRFGRVLLETDIATILIRKTTELGGDKPVVTCILSRTVTAAIFPSLFGAGTVVAIGVIILPILMSLGIPKVLLAVSFMLSIGVGMSLDPVLFGQYTAFFLDGDGKVLYPYEQYVKWGGIALAVQLVLTIILILFCMRKKPIHSWATRRPIYQKPDFVPTPSLLTPFILVPPLIVFKVPIIMGFLIGGLYALFVCGKLKSFRTACRTFNKDFFDGVVGTAPLVGFLLAVPMFNKAAELCIPYFNALLGNTTPHGTLFITTIFCVPAPLGMFRGLFTLHGCGAATLGILKDVGLEVVSLAPLVIAATAVMNASYCIAQSWTVWGISYTKVSTKGLLKMSVVCGQTICRILQIITFIMFG